MKLLAVVVFLSICAIAVLSQDTTRPSKTPRYGDAVLLVNNPQFGHGDNCFVHLAQHPEGTFIWGRKGAVSEIAYTFLGRQGEEDVYRFIRKYPLGERDMKITEITISYKNQEIRLWQKTSGKQIFILAPANSWATRVTGQIKTTQPDGAASRSQPSHAKTNQASRASGSGR